MHSGIHYHNEKVDKGFTRSTIEFKFKILGPL